MRSPFRLVLGVILLLFAVGIVLWLLITRRTITGALWLDLTFAFVFFVRGLINVRSARRPPRDAPQDGG